LLGVNFLVVLFICFFSVSDAPDHDAITLDIEENSIISRAKAICDIRSLKMLDVSDKASLQPIDLLNDLSGDPIGQLSQVLQRRFADCYGH